MNDLLIDCPPVLSPRLRWMERHEIVTLMEPGQNGNQWVAFVAPNGHLNAYGPTEEEALRELCRKLGLNHWSLE